MKKFWPARSSTFYSSCLIVQIKQGKFLHNILGDIENATKTFNEPKHCLIGMIWESDENRVLRVIDINQIRQGHIPPHINH